MRAVVSTGAGSAALSPPSIGSYATQKEIPMKTLIAAVIASAVSFGAFAQSASAPMATPMAKPMASDTAKPAHKAKTHKHAANKPMKKASAPA